MAAYLRGDWIEESHEVDARERLEEYIMLRLRLEEGILISDYNTRHDRDFHRDFDEILRPYKQAKLVKEENGRVSLTTEGVLLSNTILSDMLAELD